MVKSILISLISAIALNVSSASADSIRLIPSGKAALSVWIQELASARKSIDIATFVINPCSIAGKLIIDELKKKSAQGVRVRILVDGHELTSEMRAALTVELAKHRISVRVYNNVIVEYSVLSNMRTHAKFVVIDGEKYISGGRNIEDNYFGLDSDHNFVDRDLFVEGASARAARAAFEQLWTARMSHTLGSPAYSSLVQIEKCLKDKPRDLDVRGAIELDSARTQAELPTVTCSDTSFIFDRPDFSEAPAGDGGVYLSGERYVRKGVTKNVVDFIAATKRSLAIETWLYIPAHGIEVALSETREKGIPIRVFTNQTSDADRVAPISRYYQLRDNVGSQKVLSIANLGALDDSWELTPPRRPGISKWFIHSKAMVSDSKHVIVSSFNLDPRSYSTNLESAVVVRNCPELASRLSDTMRGYPNLQKQDRSCAKCKAADPGPAAPTALDWLFLEFL